MFIIMGGREGSVEGGWGGVSAAPGTKFVVQTIVSPITANINGCGDGQ